MSSEHPEDMGNQRLHAIIAAYLEGVQAGQEPDRQELIRRHPDLANELAAFFADHDKLRDLARPIQVAEPPSRPGVAAAAEAPTLPPVNRLARRRQCGSAILVTMNCRRRLPAAVWGWSIAPVRSVSTAAWPSR